ncbi:hypothetical protein PF002_g25144 [Phytophthora fragariae]|uniref:Uncharacterized protein n=1 Tax=Phytophthora fragariae TaxID=53985 RepID=A0A6A3WTF2_9STRA|nr:hypothetical protein PF002_g25144 [Phytophthora fragariae]
MLLAEMKRKVGGMVNDRVPDVSRLFTELKMDLEEVDVEARIAKYFMRFDRLVEDNGLTGILGRGPAEGEGGRSDAVGRVDPPGSEGERPGAA